MPSLIRFLSICGMFIGVVYLAAFVLATQFEPEPKEITKSVRNIQLR